MYKINQHLSVNKHGMIKTANLKYLNPEKLEEAPNGFYCKKWGNDYIIETTLSDKETVAKLIIMAISYITIYKKPFIIYY